MTGSKGIVLDANILIRSAFGHRVRHILKKHEDQARFYASDVAFEDARKYVVTISELRQLEPTLGLSVLDQMAGLVEQVDRTLYEQYEHLARERIDRRDPDEARCCRRTLTSPSHLDRGSGFLRERHGDLDNRSS